MTEPGLITPRPCRGCGEPLLDLIYPKTGRLAPIEVKSSVNGNITVDVQAGTYAILTGDALVEARTNGAELHWNHFGTCREASRFR